MGLGEHVFPSVKFQQIHARLKAEGLLDASNLIVPQPATREDLHLVHTPHWTSALLDGTISYDEVLRLEIPYSQPMVRGFLYHTGGSIAAAQVALEEGAAFNIGGGFHHACPDHGEGFCAIHDVAIAIRKLQASDRIRTAMIIDTDVHQGNGTATIFAQDPRVYSLSIHQFHNYPHEKPPSSLDIHLENGLEDPSYLAQLETGLQTAFASFTPDLIAYIAGSDPYREDKLGGLNLSIEGMRRRDELVFAAAHRRSIPVFVTLAGGYAHKLDDTVTLHTNTAKALGSILQQH
ncbi:histone deacetylase [Bryobacter aggregatus]|uniref:histone deacetylase family protein n=1 Tax=Bryobacter aggregatus TaxID=360054 RepID=UPI00055E41D7|nr:histone deacetylase [Bryobacter aggregatus]